MASTSTQLQLDDLIVSLDQDPSQERANESANRHVGNMDARSRSTTPAPPDEHEVLAIRSRALAIRDKKGKAREDPLVDELADMVLRLTAALPARAQVLDQAATIRCLSTQRDFLLQRSSDERNSWDAERNGMFRVCEALIAQANIVSHNLFKDQESSRRPSLIELENNNLKQKLAESQSRASSLEAELARLRPLLLMHPHSIALSKGLILQPSKRNKREDDASNENRSYYRVREEKASLPKTRKKRAAAYFKHSPTVADARAEHLLLAARKLGKERATLLSQAMYRTVEPQAPSAMSSTESGWQGQGRADVTRPMMSPAVWPNQQQIQQAGHIGHGVLQLGPQQGQQSNTSKNTKPTPAPHYAATSLAYPAQQYFVPSGSVGRPNAMIPPHALYPAQARGYVPGPAWPYYPAGPYAFTQPIPMQSANPNNSHSSVRPANGPPSAGPSHAPGPSTQQSAFVTPSSQNANEHNITATPVQKPSSNLQQDKRQRTPRSKSNATPSTSTNPPTPMDSLLSAACSVFSPDSNSAHREDINDGSPSPKKRTRIDPAEEISRETNTSSMVALSVDRRTSSLDILADQAAGVVPSSQQSRIEDVNSGTDEPALAEENQEQPDARENQSTSRKRKKTDKASTVKHLESSRKGIAGRTLPGPSRRKGKRAARGSSTAPPSRASPAAGAPRITVHRAASEDNAISTTPTSSGTSLNTFRLRPVQTTTFPRSKTPLARSLSVPHSTASTSEHQTDTAREVQMNGLAISVENPAVLPVHARTISSAETDADAEGDEVESEDDVDADADADAEGDVDADHIEIAQSKPKEPASPKEDTSTKESSSTQTPVSGEDPNSKRWLEILGRKGT